MSTDCTPRAHNGPLVVETDNSHNHWWVCDSCGVAIRPADQRSTW